MTEPSGRWAARLWAGLNVINSSNQSNSAVLFPVLKEWSHRTTPALRAQGLAASLQQKLSAAEQRRQQEIDAQNERLKARNARGEQARDQKRKLIARGESADNLNAAELKSKPKIPRD